MGEEVKMTDIPSTTHFIFVHGVCHGAWCWYKIRQLLENSGYKVSCLDLASAGIDRSNPDSITSFEDYNKPLIDFILALPEEGEKGTEEFEEGSITKIEIILVGHSAGGLSVTHAIHRFGKKIHLAIYVCATMLLSGFTSEQDIIDGTPDLSEFGEAYELGFGLGAKNPPTRAIIRKELQREILYQMSPPEDATLASMLLRPGPITALRTARFDGGDDIDMVRRIYIKTTDDHVVKHEQQEAMIKKWPPSEVFTLESDHSPFFSVPTRLFELLLKASSINNPLSHILS